MHSIDYFVLIVYLAGFFLVGLILSSRNKNSDDMFAAGGESPWWISGLSSFMTMFSAGTFVVWGGIAYRLGLVAVVINLCYGVAAILVGFFVAGHWKKMGVRTPSEFIELRFGKSAVQFYTWSMMVFRIVGVAVSLYALSVVLVAMMPLAEGNPLRDPATGNLSLTWAIIIFGIIVVVYTMAGGLWAVLMTDVIQFILLNLAVIFIVPLVLKSAGGFEGFISRAPEGFFALTSDSYTFAFMAGWVVIHFFMIGAEWAFAQRFICVPNERDAKRSCYLFGALYLISPLLWLLPPMVYRTVNPDADPQQAYILSCQSVLPIGMVGLMIAAMFSATASMVSSQLNVFAGALTQDIYRNLIRPQSSERHLLMAGRVFTALLGLVLIGVALLIPYLGGAEKVVVTITSLMVGPLLAPTIWGLFSKRTSLRAIWVTVAVSFAAGIVFKLGLGNGGFLVGALPQAWSAWVQNNNTMTDLIIGVIVPIIILSAMHCTEKRTATGWQRVQHQISQTSNEGKRATSSPMPALVTGSSLLISAILMFIIIPFNDSDHGILLTFAFVLLVLAIGTFLTLKLPSRRAKPATSGQ